MSVSPTRNIAICGLVRNCAKTVRADIQLLAKAFAPHGQLRWFLVESDSTDKTLARLEQLKAEIPNFDYVSLGKLDETVPERTHRIAVCRNTYLDHLATLPEGSVDYVVMADLDGLNTKLTADGVASCWTRDDWDVCAANQDGPYYDIYALRHPIWCPTDCWAQFGFLEQYRPNKTRNIYTAVLSRMLRIPPDSDWIEVHSAFGGLAIYRWASIGAARYTGVLADGTVICEHVPMHEAMRANGARIYINPALINAGYTGHSGTMKPWRRARRNIRHFIKSPIRLLTS